MAETRTFRTRYPARAVALVTVAALLYVAEILAMMVIVMPLLPLIPLFFAAIVGHGCALAAAVDYARGQARTEPVRRSRAEPRHQGHLGSRPHTGTAQPA